MRATEQLKAEHTAVKLMLNILQKVAANLQAGEQVTPKHLDAILDFLRTFVDKCHHGKEEDALFPALERAGIPRQNGPIGVMLAEHVKGREHVRAMSDGIAEYKRGDAGAAAKIAENAKAYIRILLAHIDKEDNVLYVMADAKLTGKQQQQELFEKFEQIEQDRIGPGKHEEFHKTLESLKKVYSV